MSDPCFTLEDVAKHNGIGDARTWLIIKNVVYDVTNYLDEHPGGGELLSEYAGRDATSAFDDYGHSSDAKSILKSYRIGQLDEKDKSANKVKSNGTKKKATDSKATTAEARKNRSNPIGYLDSNQYFEPRLPKSLCKSIYPSKNEYI